MEPVITLENVSFSYNGEEALKNVDLVVERGDYMAVIGPNGGGKTTLLKLMLGILGPTSGEVRILGRRPVEALSAIGYVPQTSDAERDFPISVLDVVLMGRLGRPGRRFFTSRDDLGKARQALRLVDMEGFESRRIGALSGGQRQRVLVARALASEPEILLLDEPATGVDVEGKEKLYSILTDLNRTMTIVMVSHEIGIIASSVKTVACVSRTVYHHPEPEVTPAMFQMMFGGECAEHCPVEIFAHGLPHRVVQPHEHGEGCGHPGQFVNPPRAKGFKE